MPRRLPALGGYAFAVGATILATLCSLALEAAVGWTVFALYIAAVAVTARYAGLGPGLVATALGLLAANYFLVSHGFQLQAARPEDIALLLVLGIVAVLVSWTTAQLRSAREAEQRQREWFQTTLASIGDGVIATDLAGRVTFLNATAEALTGWPTELARGRPIEEIVSIVNERTRQPAANPLTRAIREGAVIGLANHTLLIARDGTERAIDDSGAPIRDGRGRITGAVLVFRDVTERRQAEERLVRSQALLEESQRSAHVGSWEWDIRTNAVTWSDELYRIYGLEPQSVPVNYEGFFEFLLPEDRDMVRGILEQAYRDRQPFAFEHRVVRPTGEIRTLQARGRVIPGPDESPARMIGSGQDVTERLQIEAAIRQSEARFRAIWESAADAMALSDPDGIVLAANPAYQRLFGYPPEQVIGQPFALIFPDAQRAEALQGYRTVFETAERTSSFEAVVQRADGSETTVEARYDFVVQDGRRVAMVSMVRDISERKALEQMQQEFIAMVSHDLRNPLALIRARAQLMQRRGTYDEQSLAAIVAQVDQQAQLVQDLLEVSRLASGDHDLDRERFDLIAEARASVEQAHVQTEAHTFRVEAPEVAIEGCWDRHRLQRVLSNLLTNAVKYSPDGGEVVVRVEALGDEARVTVRDRGAGIVPEDLPRLFDRFYRAPGRASQDATGLGLGLYIARQLVEAHGGRIWAESDGPGTGATFAFTLPLDGDATPQP